MALWVFVCLAFMATVVGVIVWLAVKNTQPKKGDPDDNGYGGTGFGGFAG